RGAMIASFAGLVPLALALRRRAVALAAAAALLVVGVAAAQIPQPAYRNPVINTEFGHTYPINADDAQFILPLQDEIGFVAGATEQKRRLLATSGRSQAWRGALGQVADRPLAGYGFGTEEKVFVDRFYYFLANRVENSFLGTALQLGVVG